MPPESSPKRAEAKKIFLERAAAGLPHTRKAIAEAVNASPRTVEWWSKRDDWEEAKRLQGLETLSKAAESLAEDPGKGLNFLVGSFGFLLKDFYGRAKRGDVKLKDLGEFLRLQKAFVDLLRTLNEAGKPAGAQKGLPGAEAGAVTNNQYNLYLHNLDAQKVDALNVTLSGIHRMFDAAESGEGAPPEQIEGGDGGSNVH